MIRWVLTAIALLLLLRLVLRFVFGLLQGLAGPSTASAPAQAGGGRAKIAGELVRDPVCSTYVPRESAIAVTVGGETRYYCSTACRDKDAAAGTSRMGRAAHG
jgi:YHS domain-containing protein